jgi:amidase
MCGIVGLKPTRARTTLGPSFGEYWGPLTHEFVLTRSIRDTAAVLDAVSGMAPGDPYTAPTPLRRFADEVGAPTSRLRVGYRTLTTEGTPSSPDATAAVESAAALLAELGHEVAPTEIGDLEPSFNAGFGVVMITAIALDIARWNARLGRDITPELEPSNRMLAELAEGVTALQYAAAIEQLQTWSRRLAAWWVDNDVLVVPTSPEPPVPLGELAPDQLGREGSAKMARLVTFTAPFDVTGQPAISLPLHWNDDGLPIGVQLVAGYGREDVLLRVASQLEQARPWTDRRPPVRA